MHGVYAITPAGWSSRQLLDACELVLAAGVCALQYRDKPALDAAAARALHRLCEHHETPLIINDDLKLATELGCGVHLGQDDANVATARKHLPESAIIGASAYADLARGMAAQAAGASYVAFGSLFASATKPGARRCSPATLTAASQALHLPVVAIGGIDAENAGKVIAAGADCVAVVDAIFGQDDPAAAVRSLRAAFTAAASGRSINKPA